MCRERALIATLFIPTGFLWFWGLCFLVTTTLVALMKRESAEVTVNEAGDVEQQLNIKETYHLLLRIMLMKPIMILAAVLLTVKAGTL